MSTEKPKPVPPARPSALLTDLPAQPVDEKEAEGVKGGHAPPDAGTSQPGITVPS
ncbi:MAG: hypothetical protein ABIY52_02010 [Gemmatimonadaceae bacterium]